MKRYVDREMKDALKRYDESNKDIEELKRVVRAREVMIESELKDSVDKMAVYLKDRARNYNVIRFIPTVSDFIDSKTVAKALMDIAPIVELDVGDKVTKEIKALGLVTDSWGEAIVLEYRSLPDGCHYNKYRLIINIDDNDTITHILVYIFKRQI